MARPMPGYLPPLAAIAVTLVAAGLIALATLGGEAVLAVLLGPVLAAPPIVSAAWGVALVAGRPRRLTLAMAAGVILAGVVAMPGGNGWTNAGNIAAGLFAGLAIGRNWRIDRSLLGVTILLLPALVWALTLVTPAEMFADIEAQALELIEQSLPEGAADGDRARVMEEQTRNLSRFLDQMRMVSPWLIGIGVLGQAGIILLLTGWGIRRLGIAWPGWGVPSFTRWRLPFYLVWVLVAGIALFLTRKPGFEDVGLNLALLAASLISLQGLAVQFWVTGRLMSLPLQVAYWVIAGIFLLPVVLPSSVVLGLADQWMDIRRLTRPPEDEGPDAPVDQ